VDITAARRVGARSVMVLTGVGRRELEDEEVSGIAQPAHVAANDYDAVRWILANLKSSDQ